MSVCTAVTPVTQQAHKQKTRNWVPTPGQGLGRQYNDIINIIFKVLQKSHEDRHRYLTYGRNWYSGYMSSPRSVSCQVMGQWLEPRCLTIGSDSFLFLYCASLHMHRQWSDLLLNVFLHLRLLWNEERFHLLILIYTLNDGSFCYTCSLFVAQCSPLED